MSRFDGFKELFRGGAVHALGAASGQRTDQPPTENLSRTSSVAMRNTAYSRWPISSALFLNGCLLVAACAAQCGT